MFENIVQWFTVALLALMPISEVRGAIPVGVAWGLNPLAVFAVAVFFNALAFVPVYYGLEYFYGWFSRYAWARKLVEKASAKENGKVAKYGTLGLLFFVAIPLPVTGAWTGTLIAWLFKLDFNRAWATVALGVLISGCIVLALTYLGIELFSFL